ncbi:MAG TPA: GNAT family N-acetyltransferase [Solirubrobacteraceae bacterium]|nr:GNAT family N-acetyltransferase [Solirubrobacteraceae bacterium]
MAPLAFPDPPLTDGVIALRPFTEADNRAHVAICQDPDIARFTTVPSPYGEADARAYLQRVTDGLAAGTLVALAVVDAADPSILLGSVGLHAISPELGAAEVGYLIAAPARGRGYATRAVTLIVAWAFGTLGLERIELRAMEENAASRGVAARAGFHRVDAPFLARPECDHLPDVFFARLREDD